MPQPRLQQGWLKLAQGFRQARDHPQIKPVPGAQFDHLDLAGPHCFGQGSPRAQREDPGQKLLGVKPGHQFHQRLLGPPGIQLGDHKRNTGGSGRSHRYNSRLRTVRTRHARASVRTLDNTR